MVSFLLLVSADVFVQYKRVVAFALGCIGHIFTNTKNTGSSGGGPWPCLAAACTGGSGSWGEFQDDEPMG